MKYIGATLLSMLLVGSAGVAHAKARCSQFETQAQAQDFMHANGAYYLDRDKDGEACECLPGGSKYGDSVCSQ